MMQFPTGATATFAHQDLETLVGVTMLRLPTPEAEWHRLQRMRRVIDAASELSAALASHTRCTLVNCGGSLGTGDLSAETERLFDSLRRYTELLHTVAGEYADTLGEPIPTLALLRDPVPATHARRANG